MYEVTIRRTDNGWIVRAPAANTDTTAETVHQDKDSHEPLIQKSSEAESLRDALYVAFGDWCRSKYVAGLVIEVQPGRSYRPPDNANE